MGKLINLLGQSFGELTVIERAENTIDNKARWKCKCSCGKERIVKSDDLRKGKITSCGCKNSSRSKDLKGQKFDRLTVIEFAGLDNNKKALWKCQCDCGNEKIVRGSDLTSHKIHSCGCYKTEKNMNNLVGKKFGKLTVIKACGKYGRQILWKCQCDCGNYIEVTTNHLTTGNTQSCGCLVSKGEEEIVKILQKQNISFVKQYIFSDLRGKNEVPLRFDFAVFYKEKLFCLIEYQGLQHYQNIYNLSEEDWKYSLKRDNMKKEYCQNNNIPLIEIKYSDNISIKLQEIIDEINRC